MDAWWPIGPIGRRIRIDIVMEETWGISLHRCTVLWMNVMVQMVESQEKLRLLMFGKVSWILTFHGSQSRGKRSFRKSGFSLFCGRIMDNAHFGSFGCHFHGSLVDMCLSNVWETCLTNTSTPTNMSCKRVLPTSDTWLPMVLLTCPTNKPVQQMCPTNVSYQHVLQARPEICLCNVSHSCVVQMCQTYLINVQ